MKLNSINERVSYDFSHLNPFNTKRAFRPFPPPDLFSIEHYYEIHFVIDMLDDECLEKEMVTSELNRLNVDE